MMQSLQIGGITYMVIGAKPIITRPGRLELQLRRPKGRRSYYVVLYEDGTLSSVV